MVDGVIACVYCGGAHQRPADIRQCWADHAGSETPATTPADSPPPVEFEPRRGPTVLGRHVVVITASSVPSEWSDAERLTIDAEAIADPLPILVDLRAASGSGRSVVIELTPEAIEVLSRPPDSVDARPLHVVGPTHSFALDELYHLVWSNSIDVRDPKRPRWELLDRAVALGAVPVGPNQALGDVVLPNGESVWLDGGPIRHLDPVGNCPVLHAVQVEHHRLVVPRANITDAELAADQLAAVTHPGGAARIIAPAGSGKTRVLTERARHLLEVWRLPATAVSLVAFNKRAQEEMRARTSGLTGLQVRTLNAIALAILNGVAPFAPQSRTWRTVNEPDVRRVLSRFVTVPKRLNSDPLAPWIDALSLVRLGLVDPVEVERRYGGDVDGLADVWPHYRQAMEREGSIDFDDQIYRAVEILLTQPVARRVAQQVSRILLVDEFQDLTPAHLLMIRLLSAPGGAVFGVGDDDQTIYGYNGADPGWLIDFGTSFPGAGDHPLEVNYRCPGGVVVAVDRLLRHNRRRVDKTIRSASTDPGGWSATSSDDPVGATVSAVSGALAGGAAAHHVAVLTRVNATIAPVQVALGIAGVPISGGVGTEFAERTAIRSSLAWFRLAGGGPFAPDDLNEALRRPSRALHPKIREWVLEQRDLDGLRRLAGRVTTERDALRIAEFESDLATLHRMVSAGRSTLEIAATLIDRVGLGGAVATLDTGRHGMNRSAQGDDLTAIRQLARMHENPRSFESWLRERLAVRRDPNGVVLATVHRVKGQEWPHVIVHLADADQYPHRLADDVEEERRLFHVAVTRASSHVTIVSGERPSPFVSELTSEPPEHPIHVEVPVVGRAAPASRKSDLPDHPLLDRQRVMAVVGLVLVDQGQEWTITDLEPEAAVTERNGAVRRFRIGAKVETVGRQRGQLAARCGETSEAGVRAFDQLRVFRDRARNGKPAYTVFDDKTLAAIASTLPSDLGQLAGVKGVGPAKLELYGDDVLTIVETALGL